MQNKLQEPWYYRCNASEEIPNAIWYTIHQKSDNMTASIGLLTIYNNDPELAEHIVRLHNENLQRTQAAEESKKADSERLRF